MMSYQHTYPHYPQDKLLTVDKFKINLWITLKSLNFKLNLI
jgi:hypothetical protein